jgi:hypothetical protein
VVFNYHVNGTNRGCGIVLFQCVLIITPHNNLRVFQPNVNSKLFRAIRMETGSLFDYFVKLIVLFCFYKNMNYNIT